MVEADIWNGSFPKASQKQCHLSPTYLVCQSEEWTSIYLLALTTLPWIFLARLFKTRHWIVKFVLLRATSINITVLCGVMLCCLVFRYERFGDTSCLSLQDKLCWTQIIPKRWYLPNYWASYPRRPRSWGTEMLVIVNAEWRADVAPGRLSSHICTALSINSQLEPHLLIINVKLFL